MKIRCNNAIYVQKGDIIYLVYNNLLNPSSTILKAFKRNISLNGSNNKYEFMEFKNVEEINFFNSLDWIIDYDEFMGLSDDKISELIISIKKNKNSIIKKFGSMSFEDKKDNASMVFKCASLDHKISSLEELLLFRQGKLDMKLPKGVDYPIGVKQEKKIKKIVRVILKKTT